MTSRVVVRQDEQGVYVVHGEDKVRPVLPISLRHMAGPGDIHKRLRRMYGRGRDVRYDGTSNIKPGTAVKKHHHAQSMTVSIDTLDGKVREIWSIVEEDKSD